MKKTKLLTSLAAFVLVIGLGACEVTDDDVAPDESGEVTTTDTDTEETSGGETTGDSNTEGGNPSEGGNEGGEGNEEVFSGTYKLGALDEGNYCYRYFDGKTSGTDKTKLTTTDNWDDAVEVTIELDESAIETLDDDEEELTGTPYTLSFTDANGDTKYISWSDSTNVDLSDEAYTWYWVDNYQFFAAGSLNGRFLVYYASSQDIRAYSQSTEANFDYPYIQPYTEAQTNPEKPEVTTSYEQVSSLTDGGEYYIGGTYNSEFYLTTGQLNNYNLACTLDLDSASPFTLTGNDNDGWTLTNSDGKYVYLYLSSGYLDFGLSNATTVPSNGTKTFLWSQTATTLYTSEVQRTYNSHTYTISYFEFYQGSVAAYGTDTLNASTSNLAHFYQQVTV